MQLMARKPGKLSESMASSDAADASVWLPTLPHLQIQYSCPQMRCHCMLWVAAKGCNAVAYNTKNATWLQVLLRGIHRTVKLPSHIEATTALLMQIPY